MNSMRIVYIHVYCVNTDILYIYIYCIYYNMGVSINEGTPKWMFTVYNGKSDYNG